MDPKPARSELPPTRAFSRAQPPSVPAFGSNSGSGGPGNEPNFLAPPQAADELGRLGGYRVLRLLGSGGMGYVFLAEDLGLQRKVALKVMKPAIAARTNARERFLREGRSAAKIKHDHIITIYQVGEDRGVPFLALEFLEGMALDTYLKQRGEIPLGQVIRIGRETAIGLQAAHKIGLIHRDIKPANIWLESPGGRVKILDFGLARHQEDDAQLTNSGAVIGTPAYMSPEQARGAQIDPRSDLFSLGVMLYRLATGRLPFTGETTMAVLTALAVDEPPPPTSINPSIPRLLELVIQRLLAKPVEQRFQTAQDVVDALNAIEAQASAVVPGGVVDVPVAAQPENLGANPFESLDTSVDAQAGTLPGSGAVRRLRDADTDDGGADPRQANSGGKRLVIAAVASVVLLGGGFGAFQLLSKPAEGTLVVDVDSDAESRFKNGELQIYDAAGKLKFTLKPGDKNRSLPAGKYSAKVTGADGVKLDIPEFTVETGGKVSLRLRAEAKKVVAKVEPKVDPPASDPDRRAAEYVVSLGGNVSITATELFPKKTTVAELPKEPFSLLQVSLLGKPITDVGLGNFRGCKNLVYLALNETKVSDEALGNFSECKNLRLLSLDDTPIGDAGLAHFAECQSLTHVYLNNTQVSDAGLAHLKNCKNLLHLSLAGTKVRGPGLVHFMGCKLLTHFGLKDTKVDDAYLDTFKECKNLQVLNLANTQVTNEGLANFVDTKFLITLNVSGTSVTDDGLKHFANRDFLVEVWVKDTKIGDAGIAHFKDCRNLRMLQLEGTKVTDEGLGLLEHWKGMTNLWLNNTDVSDTGVKQFAKCKNLSVVELAGTKITDESLLLLADFKRLTKLDLRKTKVTVDAVKKLVSALPGCFIEWDGGSFGPPPKK